jgi:hypothetical protein
VVGHNISQVIDQFRMNILPKHRRGALRVLSLAAGLLLIALSLVKPALRANWHLVAKGKVFGCAQVSVRHTTLDVTDTCPEQQITEFARNSMPTELVLESTAPRPPFLQVVAVVTVPFTRLAPRRRLASRRTCDADPFV